MLTKKERKTEKETKRERRRHRGKKEVLKMEVTLEQCTQKPKNAWCHQKLKEARKSSSIEPLGREGECSHGHTLISDFQPPEL
jgi:hypothetical protein